jgi:hypothetical protein
MGPETHSGSGTLLLMSVEDERHVVEFRLGERAVADRQALRGNRLNAMC